MTPETDLRVHQFTTRIEEILTRATERDLVAARALRDIAAHHPDRFSPAHLTGLDHADAQQALLDAQEFTGLAQQPGVWAPHQLSRMSELMLQQSDDPVFAQYVMDELGLKGVLHLSGRFDSAPTFLSATSREDLQRGLANTTNTALQTPVHLADAHRASPEFQAWLTGTAEGRRYGDWTADLHELGMREKRTLSWDHRQVGTGRYGYHDLVGLMEHSDRPFGSHFLSDVTTGIIEASKEQPGMEVDRDGFKITSSLTDRALALAAANPAAATMILDPVHGDTLQYVLDQGTALHPALRFTGSDFEPKGLASALEAASLGRPAGSGPDPDAPPPNEANARIAQDIMDYFYEDPKRLSGPYAYAHPEVSSIAAEYIADFHHAVDSNDLPIRGSHHLDLELRQAESILRSLGTTPEAYTTLMAAQQGYQFAAVDNLLHTERQEPASEWENLSPLVQSGAHLVGVLTEARSTAAYENELDPDLNDWERFTERLASVASDTATLRIPHLSTATADEMKMLNASLFAPHRANMELEANKTSQDIAHKGRTAAIDAAHLAIESSGTNIHPEILNNLTTLARTAAITGFTTGHTASKQWH